MSGVMLSHVLAAILSLHCAAYRHEMHLKLRPEASSNKTTQHWGPKGSDSTSLTCETAGSEIECTFNDERRFKYFDGKCCTTKWMNCQAAPAEKWRCEGDRPDFEGWWKGWKFLNGKCCLVTGTDSQASLTCETGVKDFDCQGIFLQDTDSYKYMGHGTCCTQKRITCQASSSKEACEGFHGEEKKKGWKFLTHKCCLDLDAQANTGWFGWR